MEGIVCGRCGFLKVYWNPKEIDHSEAFAAAFNLGTNPFMVAQQRHACPVCATGELKVVSDIDPRNFCDGCCLPKNRCKCKSEKWTYETT